MDIAFGFKVAPKHTVFMAMSLLINVYYLRMELYTQMDYINIILQWLWSLYFISPENHLMYLMKLVVAKFIDKWYLNKSINLHQMINHLAYEEYLIYVKFWIVGQLYNNKSD